MNYHHKAKNNIKTADKKFPALVCKGEKTERILITDKEYKALKKYKTIFLLQE